MTSSGFGPLFWPPGIVSGSSTVSVCPPGSLTSVARPSVSFELEVYSIFRQSGSSLAAPITAITASALMVASPDAGWAAGSGLGSLISTATGASCASAGAAAFSGSAVATGSDSGAGADTSTGAGAGAAAACSTLVVLCPQPMQARVAAYTLRVANSPA
jgi:hypothetical protein